VADVGGADLLLHDNIRQQLFPIVERTYPRDESLDLAFLRASLPSDSHSYFPILTPPSLRVGEAVYSYGFFAIGGRGLEIEQGYFSGSIVNFTKSTSDPPIWSLTLPYPIIEGMSGSPVLTYHNGPKVVGLAYGNRSTRILASEIVEYEDSKGRSREAIHRIVEFGFAYHAAQLQAFLIEAKADGFVISADRLEIAGLE
jgi:hypothetical protein